MCPQTVKGDPEAGDMEDMADKKTLAVERDNSRAPAQDRSKGIVTHAERRPCTDLYEMKAPRSGTMWSVAPVLATTRRAGVPKVVVGMALSSD